MDDERSKKDVSTISPVTRYFIDFISRTELLEVLDQSSLYTYFY